MLAAAALFLIGTRGGVFTPANQKIAYGAVIQEDYGVLAATLDSVATAAGTIGTTLVVALMENNGGAELWTQAAVFTEAQRFAFTWLVLVGLVGIGIGLKYLPLGAISQR